MMLALFLDRHGVPCVIFNPDESTRWHPKGSTHNSRTMEHYRRLGLSEAIRQLGLPADHPTDVAYYTRYASHEIARVLMPSEREKVRAVIAAPRTHQNVEPIHRANQMYVERLLFEHVRTRPGITLRYGWRMTSFAEDANGVTLHAERVEPASADRAEDTYDAALAQAAGGGTSETWRVAYMAGCDGGQSPVRKALGIRYEGHDSLEQAFLGGAMIATYLRAPELKRRCFGGGSAWQYWAVNPQIRTALVALNGEDEYLYWTRLAEGARFDEADVVRGFHLACGHDTPVTVLGNRNWRAGVALWAERLWSGHRVFLAGDAIHLFTPTGGFGMNTGIDGAANLAWKIAALVQGWGGPHLASSYEIERKPIARRNTTAAQSLARNVGGVPVGEAIEAEGAAGIAARAEAGAYLSTFGEEFASIGVQLGVRYDGSPIIGEDGAPPNDSFTSYTPSAVPGGRAPHVFLDPPGMANRRSLFDLFGVGFTLLRLTASAPDGADLAVAAARRGVPLTVIDMADADARDLYGRDLALIRPDQHVCWRGNRLGDVDALLARVTGA